MDGDKVKKKGNIVYATDDIDVKNAVVTDKWTYFFSVLCANHQNDGYFSATPEFAERLKTDEYCMEKVSFDWLSYVIEIEESPYYGMTWREAMEKDGTDIVLSDEPYYVSFGPKDTCFDPIYTDEGAWTICMNNRVPLRVALLCKYGLLSSSDFSGMGKIPVTYTEEDTQKQRTVELNVVGYVETEADKLLSTGVSMDKNSDEYNIVMEQLKKPTFYSLCGNFLEE